MGYGKVVAVYTTFLENFFGESSPGEQASDITAVEVEEAIEIVKHITEYREKRSDEDQTDRARVETAEGRYTLGLLLVYTNELIAGRDCLNSALEVFLSTIGVDHDKTRACQRQLEQL